MFSTCLFVAVCASAYMRILDTVVLLPPIYTLVVGGFINFLASPCVRTCVELIVWWRTCANVRGWHDTSCTSSRDCSVCLYVCARRSWTSSSVIARFASCKNAKSRRTSGFGSRWASRPTLVVCFSTYVVRPKYCQKSASRLHRRTIERGGRDFPHAWRTVVLFKNLACVCVVESSTFSTFSCRTSCEGRASIFEGRIQRESIAKVD